MALGIAVALMFPVSMVVSMTFMFPIAMVMVTFGRFIAGQLPCEIQFHGLIHRAGDAINQLDVIVRHHISGAAADATANQHIDTLFLEKIPQGAMTPTLGGNGFLFRDFSVFHSKNRKQTAFAKMLKNPVIFRCKRYSHLSFLLLLKSTGINFPAILYFEHINRIYYNAPIPICQSPKQKKQSFFLEILRK